MAYTTIKKPSDYFNTKLYTGTGAELAITGVGFQPDWTWIKRRDAVANGGMFDNVRGATKLLSSSQTDGEQTLAQSLKSFDSDGFTLGTGTNGYVNTSGSTTVAWNWLASNTTASNTDGSITSTVSANTTSGFSIVSYTGTGANATVGHGLGAVPKMIIFKVLDSATDWVVYHVGVGNTGALRLNNTNATQTNSVFFQNTTPSSSIITIGTGSDLNTSSQNHIAYCFAEKKGFSKFGSYTGNGNADGTFVYTGFKPAFILCKDPNYVGENWFMFDSKRPGYNVNANLLYANDSASETTSGANQIDLLSNGFKMRATNNGMNRSGSTFIYMAFAEEPLVGDNPCTAR